MIPSGFEVDFLVNFADGTQQAIGVAADVSEPITRKRECRALGDKIPAVLPFCSVRSWKRLR